jgi:glycosyltransferase involved in cell wall biosynthesis
VIVALDTQLAVGTATGIGVYQRDLADALRSFGINVRALQAPRLDPWRFDRRVLWDQVVLPIAAARSGAGVLHASAGTMPFIRTLPTVVTVHDMAWLRVQGHTRAYARAYFGTAMRSAYRSAAAVVVDSRFSRDEYAELSGDHRPATVVYPGVDARFGTIVRRPDAEPFALVVGTVERRKNLLRAVEAVAAVPGLRLIAAGPATPYLADVRARVNELGIAERVELRGYVDQATIDDLYARATVALVPSHYEGFGYAVAEARCAGLPFIAARTSSLVEVAGGAGPLLEPDSAADWVDALQAILADRAAAEYAASAGRAKAQERFRWSKAAEALATLYTRAAGQ